LAQITICTLGLKLMMITSSSLSRVQELAPDFVVFTATGSPTAARASLSSASFDGTHATWPAWERLAFLGNHDYGFRWKMVDVADQVVEIARTAGVITLSNQALTVAGLQSLD